MVGISSQFCNFYSFNAIYYSRKLFLYHMEERVSIIEGKRPLIFVAPHGAQCDDVNTALIAETLADTTRGYAVINRGWERSNWIDYTKDKANCNNVEHCYKDVIKEEFFDPLVRFKHRTLKKWSRVCIVYLHGMSNDVQKRTGIDDLNFVVGWGNGNPHSHTCQKWVKDFLIYNLSLVDKSTVGEGKIGGNYSARAKNNMTQFFRKHDYDEEVDAVQIEVVNKLRKTKTAAEATAQVMGIVMNELIEQGESWRLPHGFKIPQV